MKPKAAKLSSGEAAALVKECVDNIQDSWEHDRENREEAARELGVRCIGNHEKTLVSDLSGGEGCVVEWGMVG